MIILTKEVNTLLKQQGLPLLTIQRNEDGYISLCGKKCFKPIMTFSSMPVSKKLTVAERTILIEDYLTPVIISHEKELKEFIKISQDKRAENEYNAFIESEKEKGFSIKFKHAGRYGSQEKVLEFIDIYNDELKLRYNLRTTESPKFTLTFSLAGEATKDLQTKAFHSLKEVSAMSDLALKGYKLNLATEKHAETVKCAESALKTICNL